MLKKRAIYAADKLIAVSRVTKEDILMVYPNIPQEKICVVSHGCDHMLRTIPVPPKDNVFVSACLSRSVLIHVGSRSHYKGFDDLIKALAMVRGSCSDFLLVAVGMPWSNTELNLIRDSNISDYAVALQLADAELAWLYKIALATICPSRYEGFGFPVLEAMLMGCPVVCSDNPAHLELAQGQAEVYRAGDPSALADILVNLVRKPSKLFGKVPRAQRMASRFTWRAAAAKTLDLYKSLV
ncbi:MULTISPECIES: glycosyltransferase family 4 protein [Aphanothece]|uniref:glycosyltransferase family 4 protein n=1 Tax=Aphanothece TaxID=1121 RepID=UPI003984CBB8